MRTRRWLWLLWAGALFVAACEEGPPAVVISNTTVIDGSGGPPRSGMTVVIEGDRIRAVEPAGPFRFPRPARVIDGTDKYLIPGLWDMHVHLRDTEGTLPLFLVNGVTSVRDMGSDVQTTRTLKTQIEAGLMIGPRILTPGLMLESSEWLAQYVDLMRKQGYPDEVEAFVRTRISASSPAEGVAAVDSLVALGVDFLKIRHAASRETYLAIADAAAGHGLKLTGHYLWIVSLIETAEAGQRSVEHNIFPGFNERSAEEKQEIFKALVTNDTHLVPTLVAGQKEARGAEFVRAIVDEVEGTVDPRNRYVAGAIRESWRTTRAMNEKDEGRPPDEVIRGMVEASNQFLRQAHEAGVKIMAGTDAPTTATYFGFSLHDELALLVDTFGFTPMEALRSATAIPAVFMGLEGERGTIEPDRLADLVLLEADPLVDIANSRRIDTVIMDGRVIDSATRLEILGDIEASISSEPYH
jgi:imidazolonepropionase-like amidohydrolase